MSNNGEDNHNHGDGQHPEVPNLQTQALIGEMTRLMRAELETVHQRLDRMEEERPRQSEEELNRRRRGNHRRERFEEDDYYGRGNHSSSGSQRRPRRNREGRGRTDDNLRNVKLKIPPFHGKNDPDAYLEWEKKMELFFDCQNYSENKKVQVVVTEFHEYAITWWDQVATTRRRNREFPVDTWNEMKTIMRKRFVPSHYHRELHQKLRRLTQGSKSVDDYFQEMESLMIKADVDEDREATMARFLSGLNREVQDQMELQTYEDLEQMLHKANLVEQQVKRKGSSRKTYGVGSSNPKPSYQKEDKFVVQSKENAKPFTTNPDIKGKVVDSSSKTRDIRCFKFQGRGHYAKECPNQKTLILLENGEYETEEEREDYDSLSLGEASVEMPVNGRLLVARRSLSVQTKVDEQEQRENLFHTRCFVQGKVCSLIIDGGSCANVASETMVEKLGLKAMKHPKPFKLQWLNHEGEMTVSSQVLVPLTIGKYVDEILCDILPMDASHILLGRPWQFDRRVIHDGFTNRYSFEHKGRKTTLVPLTPQEVYHDQLQLKKQQEQAMSDLKKEKESLKKNQKRALKTTLRGTQTFS